MAMCMRMEAVLVIYPPWVVHASDTRSARGQRSWDEGHESTKPLEGLVSCLAPGGTMNILSLHKELYNDLIRIPVTGPSCPLNMLASDPERHYLPFKWCLGTDLKGVQGKGRRCRCGICIGTTKGQTFENR